MKNFIPKEKLNKKAKRTLDAERRTLWDVSPVSKKIESKKRYNRKKNAITERKTLMPDMTKA